MDKRYQIFVSSTYEDLKNERARVMEAILNFNCFPAGMERFPAMDIKLFEYIKKIIDDSDYYLLIIGGRYGSVDKSSGKSWTEQEYDYAVSKGIPVLVFDHKDFTKLPANKTDQNDKKQKRLLEFKKKVAQERHINRWSNADNLALKVSHSLRQVFDMQPGTGWVRYNPQRNDNKSSSEDIDLLKREVDELRKFKQEHKTKFNLTRALDKTQRELTSLKNYGYTDPWSVRLTIEVTHFYKYQNSTIQNKEPITLTRGEWFIIIGKTILKNSNRCFIYSVIDELERLVTSPLQRWMSYDYSKNYFSRTNIFNDYSLENMSIGKIEISMSDLELLKCTLMALRVLELDNYLWILTKEGDEKLKYMLKEEDNAKERDNVK